ncbi:MAG: hypothetical protein EOP48_00500 [Sphingobacteriales bacterium]|nr:MAG: hypothetical protein EOP48_00500 [Sphingobacteriales bacterium]
MRKIVLITTLIVFLVLAFLYSKKKTPLVVADGKEAILVDSTTNQIIEQRETQSQDTMILNRTHFDRAMSVGASRIRTTQHNEKVTFSLRIRTISIGCKLGDFDFYKALTNDVNKKLFLLNIESAGAKKSLIANKRLSLSDIGSGKEIDVNLKNDENRTDIAITLCVDRKQSNTCSDKEAVSPNEWNKVVSIPNSKDYLLNYVLLTGSPDNLYLVPAQKFDTASIESLKKALSGFVADDGSIVNLGNKLKVLTPYPPRVSKGNLEILLPKRKESCLR